MKASRTLRFLLRSRPALRFIKFRILHVDDSPQRIAKGLAIGVFIGFLPLMGIQMAIAFVTAAALKANKAMAMLGVWVSNPFTAIPVYYPCYRLGRWLLKIVTERNIDVDVRQLEKLLFETLSFHRLLVDFNNPVVWKELSTWLLKIGLELTIGGVIIGYLAARITYILTIKIVVFHRQRRQLRTKQNNSTIAHLKN